MFEAYKEKVDAALEALLACKDAAVYRQASVLKAMAYSTLDAGKRVRPALMLEFHRLCGGNPDDILAFACALELIHTYSLIHDDLPCMDNDDLRRGKPACHKVYGEDVALLAGDGLLTLAFHTAAQTPLQPSLVLQATACLADRAGVFGMIGGQVIDLESADQNIDLETLREMHFLKTGALISAGTMAGCILAGGSEAQLYAAQSYAEHLGFAFQIVDDILDATGNSAALGKPVGSDAANKKATYVTLLGLERSREAAAEYTQKAKQALSVFGQQAALLCAFADELLARQH